MLHYLMENHLIHVSNMLHFPVCVTSLENIKLPKFSCFFFFSERPGPFVTDSEINFEEDANLPFVKFCHYEYIRSCSLQK